MKTRNDHADNGTGFSRRALLKAGAGAAGLTAVKPGRSAVSSQAGGSQLVFLATDAVFTLDPAANWDSGGGATILAHAYEGLFMFTGADRSVLTPNLAVEIPTVDNGGISADGLTYTVKLRPGARFHDGTPLDAAAVKFSYERTIRLAYGPAFLLEQIASIDVPDATTVVFHLKQPFSAFLPSIGTLWANGVVSPTAVTANAKGGEGYGDPWFLTHDAGSGPYELASYDSALLQATLVRDPDWWQGWPEGPHIDTVVIRWGVNPQTARLMLETGEAHIVAGLTPEDWDALASHPDVRTSEYPSTAQSLIVLNNQLAPFDDVRIRQAMCYAFNYDQVIGGIFGGHGTKLDSVVTKQYSGYAPAATQYEFDLAKAKALLTEAGHGEGLQIELYALGLYSNDQLMLELFQADLATIGVDLQVKQMDPNAFFGQHLAGDPQAAFQGFAGNASCDYPDPYDMLAVFYASWRRGPSCCNWQYYANPRMDEIVKQIEVARDPTERQAAIQEGFDLAFAEAAVVWVHNFNQLVGMRANVHGYEYNFMYGNNYAPFPRMWLT